MIKIAIFRKECANGHLVINVKTNTGFRCNIIHYYRYIDGFIIRMNA